MRLYILEGPDGGGKTTLLGRLTQWLTNRGRRVTVEHHGPYLGEQQIGWRYFSSLKNCLVGRSDVVMDRSWLSEPVYGNAYRNGANRLRPGEVQQLERAGFTCGAIVIYCQPLRQTTIDNWQKRKADNGEYVQDPSAMHRVIDEYLDQSQTWPFPTVIYDYQTLTVEELFKQVEDAEAWTPTTPYPYAGSLQARVGIVGDRANHPSFPLPFFSMLNNGCSMWLAESLAAEGVSERDLLWVNAYDTRGAPNDPTPFIANGLGTTERPLLALGANAIRWCDTHQLRYVEHKHPMFWKRFKHKLPYPLVQAIKEQLERK